MGREARDRKAGHGAHGGQGHNIGGALVTFKADKRQALWDCVQSKAGAPPSERFGKEKAAWLKPGLFGRVRFLKGEAKLRHASLQDFWRIR